MAKLKQALNSDDKISWHMNHTNSIYMIRQYQKSCLKVAVCKVPR